MRLPNELCALLPYGRSWFYERQAAGAFKHLETTLVPGERLYSGALVKRALKDDGMCMRPSFETRAKCALPG